ncbi:glycoside hydrolase [Serendipita vermifera]|nr:glycoside hydrolase [Serendipita vermifera]
MAVTMNPISSNWSWKRYVKEVDDLETIKPVLNGNSTSKSMDQWTPCQSFPSEIYVELTRCGHIPDPLVGFNEHKVQWVADEEWLYGCTFQVPHMSEVSNGSRRVEIAFEGLDTFCAVYLNGVKILTTENMFLTYKVALEPNQLSDLPENTFILHFSSARRIAKRLESKYGVVRAGSCNLGDPSRVYIRKAQYHFRWDWGPELMSSGPWKPISLNTYKTRLKRVISTAQIDVSSLTAKLGLKIDIDAVLPVPLSIKVSLESGGHVVKSEVVSMNIDRGQKTIPFEWNFPPNSIQFWWPVGRGSPNLYTLKCALFDNDGQVVDEVCRRIGFRDIKLVQEPLLQSPGTSFYFAINGVKTFIGGSNWIPADSFLTTMSESRYRAWLQLLVRGNQNCVRVWGGGIYEDDIFYEICDELGILVWQDFPFACGIYPAHEEFTELVEKEARCNLERLRHHPSLFLLCGNNEDYQQVLQWDWKDGLPAAKIYEKILPRLVEELTLPPIPYVYGSPYGGEGWDTSSPFVGDVHQWDIWAGKGAPYQDFDILGGRFISEFGVPSIPNLATVEKFYPIDTKETAQQRHPQSRAMQQHNKAGSHERRFAILMNENFRMTNDLESYVYLTQLMQSEALGYAYRVWRRKWKGDGREETSGVLVWQLNDCWPVTSWSIVDYYLRPKPAYYTIARELQEFTVCIQREVSKNRVNDRPRPFYEFGAFQSVDATLDVWATNGTLLPQDVSLEIRAFDLESEWTYESSQNAHLAPNSSTELAHSMSCPHKYMHQSAAHALVPTPSYSVVVAAILRDAHGQVLSQHVDWPQPFKFIEPYDPELHLSLEVDRLTVTCKRPVKGLVLSVAGGADEAVWSDNCIDVIPGRPYTLQVTGLHKRDVKVAYLGSERARPVKSTFIK